MTKEKITVITALIIITLTGCASVPENIISNTLEENSVKENISETNTSTQNGFIYENISELKENVNLALSEDYSQIVLDNGINVELPDSIYKLKFRQISEFEENYKKIFSLFFSEDTWSRQDYKKETSSDGMKSYSFDNIEEKIYCCVGDNGFIAMLKPNKLDLSYGPNGDNVKIYHIDRGEDSYDEYDLLDGKYSIHQAVQCVNDWLNNNYREYDSGFDFKVKTIIARRVESSYIFDITAEKYYKDVPLDSLTIVRKQEDMSKYLFVPSWIHFQMFMKDEISTFTNGSGMIVPQDEEEIDEIITLESALKFCEDKFADYNKININDINLKYTLTPVYTKADETQYRGYYVAGREFDSRLVWEFVIDVPAEELVGKGETNTYGDVRKYIYIDAVTGELFFDFQGVLQ